MEYLLSIISVFLMSTVKFVFGGLPLAFSLGFSFFETLTITSAGGLVGVTFFVYMSDEIIAYFKKRAQRKLDNRIAPLTKKVFSRKNKIIVIAKKRFGLLGIALLTPLLFSIPIGCFLAVRYFKDKQRILIYMYLAVLFWSATISSFKLLF